MSVGTGPGGSALPVRRLMSNIAGLRRCRRNDGCRVDCAHDRTDDSRLPWRTEGYGGWGGHAHHGTAPGAERPPVVFVHGNQRDACDWDAHADFFRERGYRGDELWAITFADASPSHDDMADRLEHFVSRVRDHADADEVALVGHSLGVTGARYWLHREDRYDWADSLVGLAGANHGTALNSAAVKAAMTTGTYKMSPFLRGDYEDVPDHPLRALNADETPGDVDYYTLRGSDDPLFWNCEESPALEGAVNEVVAADHDGVRANLGSVERVFEWVSGKKPYNLAHLRADAGTSAD